MQFHIISKPSLVISIKQKDQLFKIVFSMRKKEYRRQVGNSKASGKTISWYRATELACGRIYGLKVGVFFSFLSELI